MVVIDQPRYLLGGMKMTKDEMIKEINKLGLKSCASLGILTREQAQKLKAAGLVRFHHNINTCESYHNEICTTHTYQDRINTCKGLLKPIGIEKYKNTYKIIYKCMKCNQLHKNIMATDDDYNKIIELSVEN